MDDLREALSAYSHHAWVGGMVFLFGVSVHHPDGSVTIPSRFVTQWRRQMTTVYTDLSNDEKASDRNEADRILAITRRWRRNGDETEQGEL